MVQFFRRHNLLLGLLLMFAFTWPVDLSLAAYSRGLINVQIPDILGILVGYGIVIGTILATVLVSGRAGVAALLRRFLIWRVGWKWYLVALLLPPVLMLLAIGLSSITHRTMPDFTQNFARELFGTGISPWLLFLPFFLWSGLTNGEEIGWRGYVLPRLQARYSVLTASLILGVIWAFWHFPKYLLVNSTLGGGRSFNEFWIESAKILAHVILYTWVFNHTKGSLLLVTLFHASWNATWVFLPMRTVGLADMIVYWGAALFVVIANRSEWLEHHIDVPLVPAPKPGVGS